MMTGRTGASGLALFLLSLLPWTTARASAELVVFDAGEGFSALLRDGERGVFFDLGPFPLTPGILERARKLGVKSVDALYLTHLHADHASGYFSFRGLHPRAALRDPCHPIELGGKGGFENATRWVEEALRKDARRSCRKAGESDKWNGHVIETLWPVKPEGGDLNAHSGAYLLRARGGGTALLLGDVPRGVEEALVRAGKIPEGIDLVVVAHHGADDSTAPALYARAKPRYAVIPVNRGNLRERPAPGTLRTLRGSGAEILFTGDGDLRFALSAGKGRSRFLRSPKTPR